MAAALISAKQLRGYEVYDRAGERIGTLADVMLSMEDSRVRYAALAYEPHGSAQAKLLAVPITSLRLDTENECFILDFEHAALADVPGFRADAPPDEASPLLASRPRPSSAARGASA